MKGRSAGNILHASPAAIADLLTAAAGIGGFIGSTAALTWILLHV
jgi:hypothetical protein